MMIIIYRENLFLILQQLEVNKSDEYNSLDCRKKNVDMQILRFELEIT